MEHEPRDVRPSADLAELSRRVAGAATAILVDAVKRHGRGAIALSGGNTPRTLYQLLASEFRDQIPWPHVHVFWSDERYVLPDDPRSNYGMARRTLLDRVPCPPENVHPMPTHFASAEVAARDYAATLRAFFGDAGPRFDLILLGLGADGHTASLFPGQEANAVDWVMATTAPTEPRIRLTLTVPVINRAANVFVLVAGSDKAVAWQRVRSGTADPIACPAAGLHLADGHLIWWVAGAII